MAELAYAADSKSADLNGIVGSNPTASTNKKSRAFLPGFLVLGRLALASDANGEGRTDCLGAV